MSCFKASMLQVTKLILHCLKNVLVIPTLAKRNRYTICLVVATLNIIFFEATLTIIIALIKFFGANVINQIQNSM